MNKYKVTRQSGGVEMIICEIFEWDWKSKDLNKNDRMNVIFYSDSKKFNPISYLSNVISVEELE